MLPAIVAAIVVGAAGATVVGWLVQLRRRRELVQQARQLKLARARQSTARWKELALEKITEELSEAIVSLRFTDLRDRLQKGQLTAVEVLHAYQYKAAVENEKYNFVCEPVEEAEEMALACDKIVDKASKPLLGIPISVKETLPMKGYDFTSGLSGKTFQPSKDDCANIKGLIDQGAVPFIRTNITQTTMTIDTHNPIYGYTLNPLDSKRTCGGSSGGEGAALGCSASVVGLGSDLGGSVRIPAAWCGVCSLRPSTGRTPWPSMHCFCGGQNIVKVSCGPMARSVDGLVALSQALFSAGMQSLDPYMSRMSFRMDLYSDSRSLRIGYFIDTGIISVSHSSTRALMEMKAALEAKGHTLIEWTPPRLQWAATYAFIRSVFGDGGESIMEGLKDDEISPVLHGLTSLVSKPMWLRKLLLKYLRMTLPAHIYNFTFSLNGVGSVANWWKLQEEVDQYRKETVDSWNTLGLDAVICPAMPCPAMLLGRPSQTLGFCNTFIFNLLDFAAGVLPVTKVTQEDVDYDARYYPTGDSWHCTIKESLQGTAGLPVALQCAALPQQEELCLRIMKELEEYVADAMA